MFKEMSIESKENIWTALISLARLASLGQAGINGEPAMNFQKPRNGLIDHNWPKKKN